MQNNKGNLDYVEYEIQNGKESASVQKGEAHNARLGVQMVAYLILTPWINLNDSGLPYSRCGQPVRGEEPHF